MRHTVFALCAALALGVAHMGSNTVMQDSDTLSTLSPTHAENQIETASLPEASIEKIAFASVEPISTDNKFSPASAPAHPETVEVATSSPKGSKHPDTSDGCVRGSAPCDLIERQRFLFLSKVKMFKSREDTNQRNTPVPSVLAHNRHGVWLHQRC